MALEHERVLVQLPVPGEKKQTGKKKKVQMKDERPALVTLLLSLCAQPLTVDIHYYYILELSFYLSLLFSQFTDIRRKVRLTAVRTASSSAATL